MKAVVYKCVITKIKTLSALEAFKVRVAIDKEFRILLLKCLDKFHLGAIHKGRPADSGGGGSAKSRRSIVIRM